MSITGSVRQTDAAPHMWEKHPRALGERVKEHSKSSTSAILKHCMDHHHPLPFINNFTIIDKESLSSYSRGQGSNTH